MPMVLRACELISCRLVKMPLAFAHAVTPERELSAMNHLLLVVMALMSSVWSAARLTPAALAAVRQSPWATMAVCCSVEPGVLMSLSILTVDGVFWFK